MTRTGALPLASSPTLKPLGPGDTRHPRQVPTPQESSAPVVPRAGRGAASRVWRPHGRDKCPRSLNGLCKAASSPLGRARLCGGASEGLPCPRPAQKPGALPALGWAAWRSAERLPEAEMRPTGGPAHRLQLAQTRCTALRRFWEEHSAFIKPDFQKRGRCERRAMGCAVILGSTGSVCTHSTGSAVSGEAPALCSGPLSEGSSALPAPGCPSLADDGPSFPRTSEQKPLSLRGRASLFPNHSAGPAAGSVWWLRPRGTTSSSLLMLKQRRLRPAFLGYV